MWRSDEGPTSRELYNNNNNNNNIIIIQLYFISQCVHRKDNTKDDEHVNITQISKYVIGLLCMSGI